MKTGITCRTFCNRLHRCYYYRPQNYYTHQLRLLFEKILKLYSNDQSISFVKLFSDNFSNRSFTGINSIYSNDKINFKETCINCAINIDKFFSKFDVSKIMDSYNYKFQIYGNIGGIIDKYKMNVHFSFKNFIETKKQLDFPLINSYIYNITNNLENDCLVMCVESGTFIAVKYLPKDYTIARGFLTSMNRNKLRRRGDHCYTCKNTCKSVLYSNLERLSIMIDNHKLEENYG